MTTHYHALVWTDHRLAKVFHFNEEANETALVHSTHPGAHLHHKANSGDSGHAALDKEFLERITREIAHAGAILIVGPGNAKTELITHLRKAHPNIAAKVSAVETVDHPTDGELLAHGRKFFRADDRMRPQVATDRTVHG
jgi:stalled ribosome rescue protein Dom34